MAASTAGAIKAFVEGLGLGLSAYRDNSPPGAALPNVTVGEAISIARSLTGNGDFGDDTVIVEQVQVDVWQRWRDPDSGSVAEDYSLPYRLAEALAGSHLPAAPTHVYGVRLSSIVRLLEEDTNLVHHAITVAIDRRLN